MNPTTDIACPRCRADALGTPIDTALEELQLAAAVWAGSPPTNRHHSPGCAMIPTEYHEASAQLRAMSINPTRVSWILSTLPVVMVGLDAYVVVGDAGDAQSAEWVTRYPDHPELTGPDTLTMDRVIVCAMAELKSRTPGAYRELENTDELDRIVADLEHQRRLLRAVDDAWPGIDDRPEKRDVLDTPIELDHWARRVLRWLKCNEPAAIGELPIPEDAALRACRALGLVARAEDKPRCVHGYNVTYTTTRACLANAIHKGAEVCHECAGRLPADATEQHPFEEGADVECDACGTAIESSYGEPEAARA